jgi:hypothetical protein
LKLDTLSVDYVVPISEIEETIDFLSLKVATMKYASSLEKLRPMTLMSAVVPGHPLREVVCYTHAIAAASGATGSDSSYSIVTTR